MSCWHPQPAQAELGASAAGSSVLSAKIQAMVGKNYLMRQELGSCFPIPAYSSVITIHVVEQ